MYRNALMIGIFSTHFVRIDRFIDEIRNFVLTGKNTSFRFFFANDWPRTPLYIGDENCGRHFNSFCTCGYVCLCLPIRRGVLAYECVQRRRKFTSLGRRDDINWYLMYPCSRPAAWILGQVRRAWMRRNDDGRDEANEQTEMVENSCLIRYLFVLKNTNSSG